MKPVNRKSTDSYHRESVHGVDAVFERMYAAVNGFGSFAEAFDVSENTIKTWRRRGAVSLRYLEGFAKEHGVTIDFLLYGESRSADAKSEPEPVLNAEERMLLERYRSSPKELRDAALRVLLGGEPAPKTRGGQEFVFNGEVSGGVHRIEGNLTQTGPVTYSGKGTKTK